MGKEEFRTESTPPITRRRFLALIGAGAAAAVATGCGETRSAETSEPAPTSTVADNPTTPPPETAEAANESIAADDQTIQEVAEIEPESEMGLKIEDYANSFEVVSAYCDALTEWFEDGSTEENIRKLMDTDIGYLEYAEEFLTSIDNEHVEALFADGWQYDPSLVDYVEYLKDMHRMSLLLFIKTALNTHPRDIEPYELEAVLIDVDGIQEVTGQELSVDVEHSYRDNSEKNRAIELLDGHRIAGTMVSRNIIWQNIDGYWKIAGSKRND